jgi:NADH:ubiquinone oxidoreductase subunit B-like Fe-S oxidoreductase
MVQLKTRAMMKLEKEIITQSLKDLVECCRDNRMFLMSILASVDENEIADTIHEHYDFNEFGGLCNENYDKVVDLFGVECLYESEEAIEFVNDVREKMLTAFKEMSNVPSGMSLNQVMTFVQL